MLYLGSDHAGFMLKERIKQFLKGKVKFIDLGNKYYDPADDYVDFAVKVAKKINKNNKGILFCGSSLGMCIAANKIRGVRAVSVHTIQEAEYSRLHNDANVLCLSGWNLSFGHSKKIIKTWLTTPFSKADRHIRRISKIKNLEKWK